MTFIGKFWSIFFFFAFLYVRNLTPGISYLDLDLLPMLLHLFPENVSSKLCKTTPSEIILAHYKPAAGGMNALWPKLSTSSERIFIKYILIDIKNGSKLFPWSEFFFHLKPLEDIFCHFTRENCKNFVRGTFYFYIHLEPLEEGGWSFWNINLPNSTLLM